MTNQKIIPEIILSRVEESIGMLSPRIQLWARAHLITPHLIELSEYTEGKTKSIYWLVTDEIGNEDSSYRVVYDEGRDKFGLECTLQNGVQWLMGIYRTFYEAIDSM